MATPPPTISEPPRVPDHELLRCIGGGSYGEVWLARSALGTYRAVKIVRRASFDHDRPFEREFAGINKFEPISRQHEGLVDLLQVGRNDAEGYFYYVMELADCVNPQCGLPQAGSLDAALLFSEYSPKTLRPAIHHRLPIDECVALGLALTRALIYLHGQGLVHRDIKPSNIIFAGGVPKLADVGLVADVGEARSYVGTEGFIPPEGPGSPQADLYSLGILLYVLSTGKSHSEFPEPLSDLPGQPDHLSCLEFNAVVHKACAAAVAQRYQSGEEMLADLLLVQGGGSVRRRHRSRKRLVVIRNVAAAAALLTLVGVGFQWFNKWMNPKGGALSRQGGEVSGMEGTTNLHAFKRYVQGRAAFNQLTPEGKKQAMAFLREAIELDPQFLPAYEKLFDTYINTPGEEASGKAREIADTLESLNPNSEEAHLARGRIKHEDLEFDEAEKHFKLAIQANSKRPLPYGMYGALLVDQGRVAEARVQLQLCDDLDPGFPIVKALLGRCFFVERNYAEAIAAYRHALSVAQNYSQAYLQIAQAEEARNGMEAAIDARQQAAIIDGADSEHVGKECDALRKAFREAGERGYWRARLAQAEAARKHESEPYEMAILYARLSEKEQALDWLDKAYIQRDWRLRRLIVDQCWDDLRGELRFQKLLKEVGFVK